MAKNFSKYIASILIGAAAGTCFYYLEKKKTASPETGDEIDDFDDFDEDLDDDFSDDAADTPDKTAHSHMSIDINSAKEIIGEKVIETLDKTKECIEQINVPEKIDKAREIISDKMAASASSGEYTEMEMSASGTYSNPEKESDNAPASEEFFDDTPIENDEPMR